jgi:hypothetical protein
MTERTSLLVGHWIGATISNTSHSKSVLPLSNEHGAQVMGQGRRQCYHNKHKYFSYWPTRDVSLLSGLFSCYFCVCTFRCVAFWQWPVSLVTYFGHTELHASSQWEASRFKKILCFSKCSIKTNLCWFYWSCLRLNAKSAFDWVLLILTLISQQWNPTERQGGKSACTMRSTLGLRSEVKWSKMKWRSC